MWAQLPQPRSGVRRCGRSSGPAQTSGFAWINAVEGFFAKLTKRRLKRGVFHSLVALQAAIKRFVAKANANLKPFCWIRDPDKIIAAVRRGHQVGDSIH